ncbi:PH domain-containing protein [Thalassobacillus pellis]|uniref:PH domain-containing protein n=1 Tax=Thalassobacillus pellis TaxID=748008 RepID=UPI00195FEE21|nr:PH domain-containing protein [Thalassobacillus pellis]MBM7552260.1 hypothetical protein [Thalassobacillus pellis]
MKFAVKKNPLLVILVTILIPIAAIFAYMDPDEGWVGLVLIIVIEAIMIWALFQSYHEVTDVAFNSHFGPIKKSLPLYDIRSVTYSYNPLASPSWTLKRLEVTGSNESFRVSAPKDEERLRQVLKERCPNARIEI